MRQSTLIHRQPGGDGVAASGAVEADRPILDGGERQDRLHTAIIMDGNGRWAERRGLPRAAGHRAGAEAVRRIVSAAPAHRIGTLTLYAFSADNWRRPPLEVKNLMRLFRTHLLTEAERLFEKGVRLSVIGRRDRLAPALVATIEAVEARTRGGDRLHLQIAVDYSGRDAILEAARLSAVQPELSRELFAAHLATALHADAAIPDVDLLIRTGGEQRLSDFLLWECAYAEFLFTPRLWPDFDETDLTTALQEFETRERRFGGRPAQHHHDEG
ncbi:MAG: di-trans,poly-cis-decaprenylcistransferase [Gemmatimonadota bacterium]